MPNKLNAEQQVILDAIVDAVFGVNVESTITFCNDALCRMTGYSSEEVIGRNAHDLLHHSRPDRSGYPPEECLFSEGYSASSASTF